MKYKFSHYAFIGCLALTTSLVFLPSCKDDDGPNIEDDGALENPTPPEAASDERIACPSVLISDGISQELFSALQQRFTNCTQTIDDNTQIVVATFDKLYEQSEKVDEVYERGGLIVVVKPEDTQLSEWCDDVDFFFAGDMDGASDDVVDVDDSDDLLYVLNKEGDNYSIVDVSDPNVASDYEFSYPLLLNNFVSWVNRYMEEQNGTAPVENREEMWRSTRSTSDVIKIEDTFKAQRISTTFVYSYEGNCDPPYSSWLKKQGTIDVKYLVYPLYAFEANGSSSGDYYLVESTFTAHNYQMFSPEVRTYSRGVVTWYSGLYMTHFTISSELRNIGGETCHQGTCFDVTGNPVPETTIGQSQYVSGFSWGLNGSISGGFEGNNPTGSVSVGGNIGWNHSEMQTISDLSISKTTDANGKVEHKFDINNTPHASFAQVHKYIPAIACADFSIKRSWVWRVPDTKDYDSMRFELVTKVEPTYHCYYNHTARILYTREIKVNAVASTNTSTLVAPNRIPTGKLELRNNNNVEYPIMRNIEVWKKGPNGEDIKVKSDLGSYENGRTMTTVLPTGSYTVKVEATTQKKDKTQSYTGNVEVKLAETTSKLIYMDFEVVD